MYCSQNFNLSMLWFPTKLLKSQNQPQLYFVFWAYLMSACKHTKMVNTINICEKSACGRQHSAQSLKTPSQNSSHGCRLFILFHIRHLAWLGNNEMFETKCTAVKIHPHFGFRPSFVRHSHQPQFSRKVLESLSWQAANEISGYLCMGGNQSQY